MEKILFNLSFAGYTFAVISYWIYLFTKREGYSRSATFFVAVSLLLHSSSLILRIYAVRNIPEYQWYMPLINQFETLSFFGLMIFGVSLFVGMKYKARNLGCFATPVGWLAILGAYFSDRDIPDLAPALQSKWLIPHIVFAFSAYSLFAVSFGISIIYLIEEHQMKKKSLTDISYRLPSIELLDTIVYKTVVWAFPLLTLAMIFGAVWANEAWGRYWAWDPKETWSLITWFVYLLFLHLRVIQGWRGRKTVILSVVSFLFVLFTYFGVNYLLKGLHSYL